MGRWATLLRFWESQRDQRRARLELVERELEAQIRLAEELQEAADKAHGRLRGAAWEIHLVQEYRQVLWTRLEQAKAQIEQLHLLRTQRQQDLLEAARQHRRLEILQEREDAEALVEARRLEGARLDEWAVQRRS